MAVVGRGPLAAVCALGVLAAGCAAREPVPAQQVHDTLADAMRAAMSAVTRDTSNRTLADRTTPCTDLAGNDNTTVRVMITYEVPSPEADREMASSLDRFRAWLAATGAHDISDGRPGLANVSGTVEAGTLTLNGAPRPPLQLIGTSPCFHPG